MGKTGGETQISRFDVAGGSAAQARKAARRSPPRRVRARGAPERNCPCRAGFRRALACPHHGSSGRGADASDRPRLAPPGRSLDRMCLRGGEKVDAERDFSQRRGSASGLAVEQIAQELLVPQRVAESRTLANPVELDRERLPRDVVPVAHCAIAPGTPLQPFGYPAPSFRRGGRCQ